MIYFIYGEDSFRIKERLKQLLSPVKSKVNILDAAKISYTDFYQTVSTPSLLFADSPVVVENLISTGSDNLKRDVKNWLNSNSASEILLVFVETTMPDMRLSISKLLKKFITEPYLKLTEKESLVWLEQQLSNQSINMDTSAKQMLATNFSGDLWRLSCELDKLINYISPQSTISLSAIQDLVPESNSDQIFQAIEALSRKDLTSANRLINSQLAFGTSEQQLLAMIAYQFRNIATIKSCIASGVPNSQLASFSQLHPFVVQKTIPFTSKFSQEQLKRVYQLLCRVDIAIKQGKLPPAIGVDILTAQIVSV